MLLLSNAVSVSKGKGIHAQDAPGVAGVQVM
jgi:hypothetical protein